jgi:hypothetical protein
MNGVIITSRSAVTKLCLREDHSTSTPVVAKELY